MTSSSSKTVPKGELDAWLTTMNVEGMGLGQGGPRTIRPSDASLQPLLRAFALSGPGSSAAPIEVGVTLAEGGMGVVKLAEQRALGRTVVVKTLRGDYAAHAAEHVLREAWATGALEHPNIVPVHDIRVDDQGVPVIVLKKIEGDSWSALMHEPGELRARFAVTDPLDWNLDILRQVCQAVRYAHSRGILHRDLKPDNVMIGEFGEVYLVDWGIAVSLDEDADCPLPSARQQSAMAGTPCYLAPEMLGGEDLDARTDIYLLGAVLFEILAGRPPHRTDDLTTLLTDIRNSTPLIPEDAPPGLSALCRKAMAARKEDRFADASAFAIALQNYSQTRGSQILADEARVQLDALRECLAASEVDHQEAYRFFGAVRFGYETALATWPENAAAVRELDKARLLMVEYELARGHALAAESLLLGMAEVPAGLLNRIAVALEVATQEQVELAKFRDDARLDLGSRTRVFLIVVFGTLWTTLPLVQHVFEAGPWHNSYPAMVSTTTGLWGIVTAFWLWARESMSRTIINKRITMILMALFPCQILLFVGASRMKMPYVEAELLMIFLWAVITAAAVAVVERKIWPTALGYLAAFLFSIEYPDARFLAMAAANFGLLCNGVIIWFTPETMPRLNKALRHLPRRSA